MSAQGVVRIIPEGACRGKELVDGQEGLASVRRDRSVAGLSWNGSGM